MQESGNMGERRGLESGKDYGTKEVKVGSIE